LYSRRRFSCAPTHGLGDKNIVTDWRILDFLGAGMALLDSQIDRSDPAVGLYWKAMQAAASQRVDHFNWRHGATYLIAAEFRAVMYATSNPSGSEFLSFAGWLSDNCPIAFRPALDAVMANYPELSECLRIKHEPLLIRTASVQASSVLTEKGEDATSTICQLTSALAKSKDFFDGISQIGVFELRNPLSADGSIRPAVGATSW
jgi:hypothetical protein